MKLRTNLKSGGMFANHNQNSLVVKSQMKAGGMFSNHNQPVSR